MIFTEQISYTLQSLCLRAEICGLRKERITMKRIYIITISSALLVILAAFGLHLLTKDDGEQRTITAGFVYVGDTSTAYTGNFVKAQKAVEKKYGDRVRTIARFNVTEGSEDGILKELVEEGCDIIFTTSFGFGEKAKQWAAKYPKVQFCQSTCSNANEEPKLSNYHTYMGAIYQGRYISGVAAGMKLKQLIEEGIITEDQAKVGYVGAYPYAEVISGYTAFFLGVRSVLPSAEMTVKYTNTWGSYALEKKYAAQLINEGCVIISQHSDTTGPAVACEEVKGKHVVYHVGYNQSMADVAPTTYLTGCRINWEPYISAAVEAVLSDKDIEGSLDANINGNDAGAGFDQSWVQMLEVNELIAAPGTKEEIEKLIGRFKKKEINVFQGDYTGVDPDDPKDVISLEKAYHENEKSSAPTFHYVLQDVIHVEE